MPEIFTLPNVVSKGADHNAQHFLKPKCYLRTFGLK